MRNGRKMRRNYDQGRPRATLGMDVWVTGVPRLSSTVFSKLTKAEVEHTGLGRQTARSRIQN